MCQSYWNSELGACTENRFIVDRWNFGVPLLHQNSNEITDVRYGTSVRRTHTCTFNRVCLIMTSLHWAVSSATRDPFLTKLVRARVILCGALIEGGFLSPSPREIGLLSNDCADTAWIHFKWKPKVEKDWETVSLFFDLRLNLDPLFHSFPFLSPSFSLSHTVGSSLLVRRAISSECISFTYISCKYLYDREYFCSQRAHEKNAAISSNSSYLVL